MAKKDTGWTNLWDLVMTITLTNACIYTRSQS